MSLLSSGSQGDGGLSRRGEISRRDRFPGLARSHRVMIKTQRDDLVEHLPKAVGACKVPVPVCPGAPQAEIARCHPSLSAPGTQGDVGLDLRPENSVWTKGGT